MSARQVIVEYVGKDKSLGKTTTEVEGKTSRLSSTMKRVSGVAGKALATGAVAGAVGLYKLGQQAAEDETAANKLSLALKKNANATDAQVASVEDWITAQGKQLGVSDDQLRPALSRLVAATKDVGEAQKLTSLAMDTAAGTGKSLDTVVNSLIRAQNGNAASLSRLGIKTQDSEKDAAALQAAQIRLRDAQHDYNESLKENGAKSRETKDAALKLEYAQTKYGEALHKSKKVTIDFGEAQKRLNDAYGGQAAKAAETTAGKQKILQVQLAELGETIGYKVLPVMVKLSEIGLKMVDWVSKNLTFVGALVGVLVGLAAAVWAVGAAVKVYEAYTKVAAAAQWLWNAAMTANPIGLVVVAIAALVAGLVIAYKKSETFRKIVNGAFAAVKKAAIATWHGIQAAGEFLWKWLTAAGSVLKKVLIDPYVIAWRYISEAYGKIKDGAAAVRSFIVDKFQAVIGFFRDLPGRIGHATVGMFDGIKDAFRAALNWIIEKWNNLAFTIPSVNTHIPGIGNVGGFTLGTPNIDYFAKGGRSKGGLAVVGERGPELVSLPRGATVTAAGPTAAALGGGMLLPVTFQLDGKTLWQGLVKVRRDVGRPLGLG